MATRVVNGTRIELTPQQEAGLRQEQARIRAASAQKRSERHVQLEASLSLLIAATGMTRQQLKEAIQALQLPTSED